MEEFPNLGEGEESTATQSMTTEQDVTQTDIADQLSQEVIVIITDTESDEDQEEENGEEDVEQVANVRQCVNHQHIVPGKPCPVILPQTVCPLLNVGLRGGGGRRGG